MATNPLPKILAEQVAVFRTLYKKLGLHLGYANGDKQSALESFLQEALIEAYRAGATDFHDQMNSTVLWEGTMGRAIVDGAYQKFLADISKDGAITP